MDNIRQTPGQRTGILLAVLLTASAGAVDIIGYLQFDHVFVANMTGNTVFFASDVVALQFFQAVHHLLPIVTFLAGVVVSRIVLMRHDWIGTGGNDEIGVDIMCQHRDTLCGMPAQERRFADRDAPAHLVSQNLELAPDFSLLSIN
jgi:hypothetical protein